MEATHHPDERPEDKWNTIFDKVFADLRASHPADEWTLRLVSLDATAAAVEQPATSSLAANDSSAEVELMMLEQLGAEAVEENKGVGVEVIELAHCSTSSLDEEKVVANLVAVADAAAEPVHQAVEIAEPNASETAALGSGMDDPDCGGQQTEALSDGPAAALESVPVDNQRAEVEVEEMQSVQQQAAAEVAAVPMEKESAVEEPQAAEETCPAGEICPAEESCPAGESPPAEETRPVEESLPAQENLPAEEVQTNEAIQSTEASNPAVEAPVVEDVQTAGTIQTIEASKTAEELPPSEEPQIVNVPEKLVDQKAQESGEPQANVHDRQEAQQPEPPHQPDAVQATGDGEAKATEVQPNTDTVEPTETAEVTSEPTLQPAAEQNSEPTADVTVTVDLSANQVVQVDGGLGAFKHDGSPIIDTPSDSDPPKTVEEVQVQPTQSAQQPPLTSSPSTAPGSKSTPATPVGKKKRPNVPPPDEPPSRKPEWMRRPLVRKGSVGRFLGRMKETMQSKRFGPDRLPVVPPPEPEPPKRPPRRKTLANLDLNRESGGREQSQTDSPVTSPGPPPPTPKSPSHNSEVDHSSNNRSGTLRSTTSERKRRNSVGRLAASAASRIGRALSTKNLNHAGESATTAEAAPLLQQESQNKPPVPPSPSSQSPSSPTDKTMTIKKDLSQLMRRMDPRQVFDRIMPHKPTPTEEAAKTKPLPERPPPPSSTAAVAKDPTKKPIVKNGKVQFQCQKCQHQWSSVKGTVRFEILMNQVGEGIRRGEVLLRLYGQRCNRCPADGFETADWTEKAIEKVLIGLRADVGRRFYPADLPSCDERGPKAHQRQLCQACQEGVCQRKSR